LGVGIGVHQFDAQDAGLPNRAPFRLFFGSVGCDSRSVQYEDGFRGSEEEGVAASPRNKARFGAALSVRGLEVERQPMEGSGDATPGHILPGWRSRFGNAVPSSL